MSVCSRNAAPLPRLLHGGQRRPTSSWPLRTRAWGPLPTLPLPPHPCNSSQAGRHSALPLPAMTAILPNPRRLRSLPGSRDHPARRSRGAPLRSRPPPRFRSHASRARNGEHTRGSPAWAPAPHPGAASRRRAPQELPRDAPSTHFLKRGRPAGSGLQGGAQRPGCSRRRRAEGRERLLRRKNPRRGPRLRPPHAAAARLEARRQAAKAGSCHTCVPPPALGRPSGLAPHRIACGLPATAATSEPPLLTPADLR